ncbi:MAG: hypothetical protein Q8R82_22190 [Hyphomonadaceae bacterium]|nr:hypothetical protein [Hyphomonadaceae bacterium]
MKDNSLTIVLMLMFAVSLSGQWFAGWHVENEDLERHGGTAIGLLAYLASPQFLSSLFENWESEFLQMAVYVMLTASLVQRGSSESRDPDAPPRDVLPSNDPNSPTLARVGGLAGWLFAHSLGLALTLLFLLSFALHWQFSANAAAQEAKDHHETIKSTLEYLGDPQLWFESFQNWQSEFLSTAFLVVLSIFLRQSNSPESKSVAAPNSKTGSS